MTLRPVRAWSVPVSLLLALGACGSDAAAPEDGGARADAGGPLDAHADVAVVPEASVPDVGPPEDPCPNLPIPATCFGRSVVYREWGPLATGDGSYFADQAPDRLGFNRIHDRIWIVKFRVEDNTYTGRVSAYGDSTAGVAWISDSPCDAAFAVTNKLVSFGNKGGGTIDFVVAKSPADRTTIETDAKYAGLASWPKVRGNHCYYAAFENTADQPPQPYTPGWFATTGDDCGASGNGTCSYLALDFSHELHSRATGTAVPAHVIDGLTILP